jgi:hypothetical protein
VSSGNNGKSAGLGSSSAMTLSFKDASGNKIPVLNSKPIDIYMSKPFLPDGYVFNHVNASELYPIKSLSNFTNSNNSFESFESTKFDNPNITNSNITNSTQSIKRVKLHFMQNTFNISTNNASVHLQIRPDDLNTAYLIVFKFNGTPDYNATKINFDYLKILCPNSSI